MSKILAAHQPNFMPYLGFFDKMKSADIFVIRDDVQFCERDWHHRNEIRVNGNGTQKKWLTIPVERREIPIKEIVIKNNVKIKNLPWNIYLARQIHAGYANAPFFNNYFPAIEEMLLSNHKNLIDLNMDIINFIKNSFEIYTPIILTDQISDYMKSENPTMDLIALCKKTNSDTYLSGQGGRNYLDRGQFEKNGIELRFQDFHHPVYTQNYPGFVPNLASIDALFCIEKFPK